MAAHVTPGQLGLSTPLGELFENSTTRMNAEIRDYVELGVQWARIDLHWSQIQPTSGSGYNWYVTDQVFNALQANGIKIIGVLGDLPRWVDRSMQDSWNREQYADFAEAAAKRYGGIIDHWEVMNEPNMKGITPENYTRLLDRAHDEIKQEDASDVVVSGGLAATPSTGGGLYGAVDYLQRMYAAGASDSFDAVGYHPYTYPLFPADDKPWNGWQIMLDGIRPTMVSNGDSDKQVWMTEVGAPTWGSGTRVSEWEQAEMLRQSVDYAKDHDWAGPILWYSYKDRGGGSSIENWFGMIREDGSRKQAYDTFKSLAATDAVALSIDGTGSRDRLNGTSGDDMLNGGGGNDVLRGNGGNDVFVFDDLDMGRDVIVDFSKGDKINLSGIDADVTSGASAFDFIGGSWLSSPGDLGVYVNRSANETWIRGQVDGSGGDFDIMLMGTHALTSSDFIL